MKQSHHKNHNKENISPNKRPNKLPKLTSQDQFIKLEEFNEMSSSQ